MPSNALHGRARRTNTVCRTPDAITDSCTYTITNCKPDVKSDASANATVFAWREAW